MADAAQPPQVGRWLGPMLLTDNAAVAPGGEHEWTDENGTWHMHLYPVDAPVCWCGWTPPEPRTETTVTVTAASHGVLNPDGTWTVEEWRADDAESTE